ncbi:MAG: DUF4338 domain-containing protein [Chloroflexota bacterium]|nr:DUF4338 domain-containing protein [Chloroflexota bacterium]MDE2960423.1 DUF4338 domain-containing protein [Chloroflexota bacterium]
MEATLASTDDAEALSIELRQAILTELESVSCENGRSSKDSIRGLHLAAVRRQLVIAQPWLQRTWPKREHFFADGTAVDPHRIAPILVEVAEPWQYDVFRLARLTWSLPFTRGYGRRLRFLVMDQSNEKLIGVIGLQSPPLDFPARDNILSYPKGEKTQMVNQTMDIYTLGAVPPYSILLGGKLIAYAAASDEVRVAYRRKYNGRVTVLDKRALPAELIALSTTSAFGRSSLYNRLSYNDPHTGETRKIAVSLGYTKGYGSFHLSAVYPQVKAYLEDQGVSTKGGFGVGPRIVWQTYVRALNRLGLSGDVLRHGVQREIFWFPLAKNTVSYLNGDANIPEYYCQSFDDLSDWWRNRWLIPRSERGVEWGQWDHTEIRNLLTVDDDAAK